MSAVSARICDVCGNIFPATQVVTYKATLHNADGTSSVANEWDVCTTKCLKVSKLVSMLPTPAIPENPSVIQEQ